jgi:hypothetical protein
MLSKSTQWILWAMAMVVFLALTLTGHTALLGLTITAVAVIWYSVVPQAHSEDNRNRR